MRNCSVESAPVLQLFLRLRHWNNFQVVVRLASAPYLQSGLPLRVIDLLQPLAFYSVSEEVRKSHLEILLDPQLLHFQNLIDLPQILIHRGQSYYSPVVFVHQVSFQVFLYFCSSVVSHVFHRFDKVPRMGQFQKPKPPLNF